MKKTGLLLFFALFLFGNQGFSKDPEIINPPRPIKKYKWLLYVEHEINGLKMHKHYFFVNEFETRGWQLSDDLGWQLSDFGTHFELVINGGFEECYYFTDEKDVLGAFRSAQDSKFICLPPSNSEFPSSFPLGSLDFDDDNYQRLRLFLKAKAPRPLKNQGRENETNIKPAATVIVTPQKAKVVFK